MSCPACKGSAGGLCVARSHALSRSPCHCMPGLRILCALLRSACWSCISSCAKTASCLGVSVGKLAWVYSAGSLGIIAGGCVVGGCGIVGTIAGAGLACCCILWMACSVGQWRCYWRYWHGKRLRESRWCHCWLCDDRTELRGCWLRQLLQLERMGIPHARKEAFLSPADLNAVRAWL